MMYSSKQSLRLLYNIRRVVRICIMKKSVLTILSVMICALTINMSDARTTNNSSLSSAIRLYKSGNYAQSYNAFNNIIKKDPSNAVAYYYLAMTSAQIGKRDEAIANYEKVLTLSTNGQLTRYARKGKTCIESPDKCGEPDENETDLDRFIRSRFGSGFSEEARSDYERQKIENLMREMNRQNDIAPGKFKEYKDFSSQAPTNDEIVTALRVLQRAGLGNVYGSNYNSDLSLLMGNNNNNVNNYDMLNMLMGRRNSSSVSPEVIQSLITNQINF